MMLIYVLNNLLVEYDTVVETMEIKVDDLVDALTCRNLKNSM